MIAVYVLYLYKTSFLFILRKCEEECSGALVTVFLVGTLALSHFHERNN